MKRKKQLAHKRVSTSPNTWFTLCGHFGENSTWMNTWKAVTCKKCQALKGSEWDKLNPRNPQKV